MANTINTEVKWKIVGLPTKVDDRGSLTFIEEGRGCLFTMKRVFIVYDVPEGQKRGGHAHRESWQMHFCLNGVATVRLDDGQRKEEVFLDSTLKGLLVAPLVWSDFELSSKETSLVVISSNLYNEKDYIRNYDDFLKTVR